MPDTALASWLFRLEHQHEVPIQLGLERVATVWQRLISNMPELGSQRKKLRTISVAGTNGKGSTVACMESLLLAHDYRVGTYTTWTRACCLSLAASHIKYARTGVPKKKTKNYLCCWDEWERVNSGLSGVAFVSP